MTDSVKQVWRDLGEQIGDLGASIQARFREAPASDASRAEHEAAVRDALRRLVDAGRELGERLGDVANDEVVQQHAKAAATSLDAALTATVEMVAGKVERLVQHERPGDRADTPPPA